MEVFDPHTNRSSRYHKYLPRGMAHYSKDALERLRTRWITVDPSPEIPDLEGDGEEENPDFYPDMSSGGEDQQYADAVRCGLLNAEFTFQC